MSNSGEWALEALRAPYRSWGTPSGVQTPENQSEGLRGQLRALLELDAYLEDQAIPNPDRSSPMDGRKLSDAEIREAVRDHFEVRFMNFSGDSLMESLETDKGVQGSEADYDRACELMERAALRIQWT